nr:MAG TPA: hypothetical protein [Caudoviricetes sp.]
MFQKMFMSCLLKCSVIVFQNAQLLFTKLFSSLLSKCSAFIVLKMFTNFH